MARKMQMKIERGGGPIHQHNGMMISRLFTSKAWMERKIARANRGKIVHAPVAEDVTPVEHVEAEVVTA